LFSVQLRLVCRECVGKRLNCFLPLFSPVIEVFFRCYFRNTRRFMLRSKDELNTTMCMSLINVFLLSIVIS